MMGGFDSRDILGTMEANDIERHLAALQKGFEKFIDGTYKIPSNAREDDWPGVIFEEDRQLILTLNLGFLSGVQPLEQGAIEAFEILLETEGYEVLPKKPNEIKTQIKITPAFADKLQDFHYVKRNPG